MYPEVDGLKSVLPPGSFVTCSSDDTIRVWNLDTNMPSNTVYKRNIYSNVSEVAGAFRRRWWLCGVKLVRPLDGTVLISPGLSHVVNVALVV